jgi:RNA polymerase sigma-70 factor (ECF subfamily)
MPAESTDEEIITRILGGEINAFDELLRRYRQLVFALVSRHVPRQQVEEVAEEVFVKAYFSLARYERRSPFGAWLTPIALRTCCDFWRQHARNREISLNSFEERDPQWLDQILSEQSRIKANEMHFERERRDLLDLALAQLSAEDRMVLELVYLEGREQREVAKMLGMSLANVKIRSFRARRKLQQFLAHRIQRKGTRQ